MRLLTFLTLALLAPAALAAVESPVSSIRPEAIETAISRLTAQFGQTAAPRIRTGVVQVAQRWWPEDGDEEAFVTFCTSNFLADPQSVDAAFERIQHVAEQIDGHLHEVRRELTTPQDLDTGTVGPVDKLLGNLDLAAHVDEDLFRTQVAFLALLNFPVHTLRDRLEAGGSWDRATWARSRMMDRFAQRVPAPVLQEMTRAFNAAEQYIAAYYIRMDRLVDDRGERPFPEGLRLITHWNLRDELKSRYSEGAQGLAKQRLIQKVMERIVRQEIPHAVIDNPELMWNPFTNEVRLQSTDAVPGTKDIRAREPDTRYARLLEVFRAVRQADPYAPTAPTFIQRRFELDRQIPEKEVEALLTSVIDSKEVRDLARLIESRLGRKLEPFDIWYAGFMARGSRSEKELDRIVGEKYPTTDAFQADLPRILRDLGFTPDKADWLARNIVVDPSRGAGHAMGAVRRQDSAHLRTRIPAGGMNYKGYNIAIHELGHNVEQTFSLQGIDSWYLNGVPNTAFTEALAFVFQARDLELLGLGAADEEAHRMEALSDLWGTFEIGGVGVVDMRVWNWMYTHPQATPAELREATLAIAREVWNRWYAPIFGVRDVEILAVYSHMISNGLYLPDYPLGHIIAFQVARKMREGDFGQEFERMTRQGRLTPDAWMRGAVGRPISAQALLEEAGRAMQTMRSAPAR